MSVLSFEAAKARETLREAETQLRQAEELADADCGIAANPTLQNRMRLAERRVEAAKAALRKIDPTWLDGWVGTRGAPGGTISSGKH